MIKLSLLLSKIYELLTDLYNRFISVINDFTKILKIVRTILRLNLDYSSYSKDFIESILDEVNSYSDPYEYADIFKDYFIPSKVFWENSTKYLPQTEIVNALINHCYSYYSHFDYIIGNEEGKIRLFRININNPPAYNDGIPNKIQNEYILTSDKILEIDLVNKDFYLYTDIKVVDDNLKIGDVRVKNHSSKFNELQNFGNVNNLANNFEHYLSAIGLDNYSPLSVFNIYPHESNQVSTTEYLYRLSKIGQEFGFVNLRQFLLLNSPIGFKETLLPYFSFSNILNFDTNRFEVIRKLYDADFILLNSAKAVIPSDIISDDIIKFPIENVSMDTSGSNVRDFIDKYIFLNYTPTTGTSEFSYRDLFMTYDARITKESNELLSSITGLNHKFYKFHNNSKFLMLNYIVINDSLKNYYTDYFITDSATPLKIMDSNNLKYVLRPYRQDFVFHSDTSNTIETTKVSNVVFTPTPFYNSKYEFLVYTATNNYNLFDFIFHSNGYIGFSVLFSNLQQNNFFKLGIGDIHYYDESGVNKFLLYYDSFIKIYRDAHGIKIKIKIAEKSLVDDTVSLLGLFTWIHMLVRVKPSLNLDGQSLSNIQEIIFILSDHYNKVVYKITLRKDEDYLKHSRFFIFEMGAENLGTSFENFTQFHCSNVFAVDGLLTEQLYSSKDIMYSSDDLEILKLKPTYTSDLKTRI